MRTQSHINSLFEIAKAKSDKAFSNGDFVKTPMTAEQSAAIFIKDGFTKSQIKTKLKSYNRYALEVIIAANNAQWSELAKLELSTLK